MANSGLLNTSMSNWGALLGNGRVYTIPHFQRDYSWREEEWEDLWNDIVELKEEQVHYMGYVVLQSEDMQRLIIIDGQQRFSTLSVLALAVLKRLDELIDKGVEPEANRERQEILRRDFLGHKDPSSLIPTSKLFLNRNNDDFYQSYLLRLRKPANVQKLKPSEKLLWKAFVYFHDRLGKFFGSQISGQGLAKFLNETVAKRLIFTVIQVSDELSAYKVFETLNARGVRLSTTDLVKNYLFSLVARNSPAELAEAERQWQSINNTLGAEDFTTFLRYYWNSRHSLERKSNLFKAIRNSIEDSKDAFALLDELESLAAVYVAFSKPADGMWGPNRERRRSITELELFNVTQCFPALLSGYEKLPETEFTKLLQICVVISFRYGIIGGLNPNTMEDVYNRTAMKIHSGELLDCKRIFQELKPIYVGDNSFRNDFSTKDFDTGSRRGKRLARYILFALENHLAHKDYDFDDANATIEHILPENASEAWSDDFSAEEQEEEVYRLGNLTLLEATKNKECGNQLYADKVGIYQTSAYLITAQETNYTEWRPTTLQKRQEKMAKWATAVWRIDY